MPFEIGTLSSLTPKSGWNARKFYNNSLHESVGTMFRQSSLQHVNTQHNTTLPNSHFKLELAAHVS